MKNDEQFKQLINKIESVDNILVTVSRNPSVDELTAALALSLALNQLKKRSVAVFSGEIPSVMHFLDPEKTFESNADSLRDFIISISKDKADRLRVRPEGNFVKVYITPYRTSITKDDLKFSEGDFNVQLVIAFGVTEREDLDASIASHGRIFHNAVAATINLSRGADNLGTISLQDIESGCYSVSCYQIIKALDSGKRNLVNSAVATALLTGIVSATDQFRNNVTSPNIMTVSAELMTKGADPQLVSSELEGKPSERRIIDDESSDDISNNTSLSFSREQTPPPASRHHDKPQQQEENDNQGGDITSGKRYSLDDGESAPEHLDNAVERRLWQDTMSVNRENSNDALRAAEAQLSQEETDSSASKLKEPEVVKLESNGPTQPAVQPEAATFAPTAQSVPRTEPTILSVTPMSSQAAAPANDARYSGPSVSTPSLNVPNVPKREDSLPFNEPNQVSPIKPIFNSAPSAPANTSAPASAASPIRQQEDKARPQAVAQSTTVSNLPMPPEPPAPVAANQLSGMPPVPVQTTTPQPVQVQTIANVTTPTQPTVPQPQKVDPAQFVIPS